MCFLFGKDVALILTFFLGGKNGTEEILKKIAKVDSITLQPLWNPHELPLVPWQHCFVFFCGGFQIFFSFHPYLRKILILTHIFQRG